MMIDLSIDCGGIKSPNPFWLASAPPSNSAYQNCKAFEAGWGGTVWKTIGGPVMNVCNRYSSLELNGEKLVGINNVELISDRNIEINLKEIAETKRLWPDRAVVVSLMVESKEEVWKDIVNRTIDTGADGIELNYGCPHGMSERGMGAAVGQVPEYCKMITEWVTDVSTIPVLVKLTPNVTNIRLPARAAKQANAQGIALINTINSVMGIDLDTMKILPSIAGQSSHGGFAGPAVKPIALHMVSEVANDPEVNLPISGVGGISTWRDALEFILLGSSSVQICTAVMHHGFRIIDDLIDGLTNWMELKGYSTLEEIRGIALNQISDFGNFDLLHKTVAKIDQGKCIHCNLCYISCEDGAHQAIDLKSINGYSETTVKEEECVGCSLCALVCPVDGCISMVRVDDRSASKTWNELTAEFEKQGKQLSWENLAEFQKKHGIVIH